MPSTTLLLWVLTRALLLPHEPVTFSLVGPGDLPAGRSVAGLIETGIPAVTSDRFDASGVGIGTVARIGAYGESWTETTYRIGDLDVTNPLRPGTPIVLPDATAFSALSIMASGSDPAISTAGTRVLLEPMRPADKRTVIIDGAMTPASWAPTTSSPPAITALRALGDASALFSGPINTRVGAVIGLRWAQASHVARDRPFQTQSLAAATAHIVAAIRPHEEVRALVIAQGAAHPAEGWLALGDVARSRDRMGLAQVTWERRDPDRLALRVSGGYQRARLDPAFSGTMASIDSVRDGAVLPLLLRPAGTTSSLRSEVVVSRRASSVGANDWRIGATIERHAMRPELLGAPGAFETVNGEAARVWIFDAPTSAPSWRQNGTSVYAGDVLSLGQRITLDGSIRFETLNASNGSGTQVSWAAAYPRAFATVTLARDAGVTIFAGISQSGGPLAPMALALGDTSSPSGRVYRWTDSNLDGVAQPAEYATLVARVGPGAWSAGTTAIDASLRRPRQTEGVFGLGIDRPRWTAAITGIVRRQSDVLQVVNDGATYSPVAVADEGLNYPFPPPGVLTAFSRNASSFGLDQYRLTNPDGLTSHFEGLDASMQFRTSRMSLAFGATAARTSATTVLRGFRVDENDPGLLDFGANPNGLVNAVGRPFFDRGYTGKIALVVRLPYGVKLGALIRYQDGQPFSRLADVDGLNQGPEPVSAYARGRTRFTFVGTMDVRLQKTIGAGPRQAVVYLDVFDVFNARREVEELVATTLAFRAVSAVEPPRSARLGLRIGF
ncbi:MAG: hypothetical protein ABI634_06480 [Acidobacteriota bacterium]